MTLASSANRHWRLGALRSVSSAIELDKTGWDNFLEFPLEISSGSALDKTSSPISCLVQVKSTDSQRGRFALKLTNWLRLSLRTGPSFILILEFGGTDQCQRAFLVHVDKRLIYRVLQRLRKLSAEGHLTTLSRHTLSVAYGDVDRLDTPSGQGLMSAITEKVSGGMDEYVTAKSKWLNEVGYEDGHAQFVASFSIPESYEDRPDEFLVDFAIGIVEKIEVNEAEIWDVRFGVRAPRPDRRISAGGELIALQGRGTEADLTLRGETSGREVRVPAHVFTPSGVASLVDERSLKFRLEFSGGQLVVSPGSQHASFDLTVPEEHRAHKLGEVLRLARLIRFLDWGSSKSDEIIQMSIGEESLGTLRGQAVTVPAPILAWADFVNELWGVLRHFDLPSNMTVTIGVAWRRAAHVRLANQVLNGLHGDLVIGFSLGEDTPLEGRVCYPLVLTFSTGEHRCLVSGAVFGGAERDEREEHRWWLKPDATKVFRKNIFSGEESPTLSVVEMLTEVREAFEAEYEVLVWWSEAFD